MDHSAEASFRLAVGLVWFTNTAVRLYYQRKAVGAERAFARNERRERIAFGLFLAAYLLILLYVFRPWLDFAALPFSATLRWSIGGGCLLFSLALFGWTHRTLGRNWSGALEIHTGHVLVVDGPYRLVRHPMYAAFYLSGLGYFLLTANGMVGLTFFGALTWMYGGRVGPEERMMVEQFGAAYESYMRSTGRLLPRIRPDRPAPLVNGNPSDVHP